MQEEREFFRAVDARFQKEVSDIKSCGKLRFLGTADERKENGRELREQGRETEGVRRRRVWTARESKGLAAGLGRKASRGKRVTTERLERVGGWSLRS